MKKLDYRHLGNSLWLEISAILIGSLLIAAALLADILGAGDQSGFGSKQAVLSVLGSGLLSVAIVDLIARRYGWDPEIPTLTGIKALILKQWHVILLDLGHVHKPWMDVLTIITLAIVVGFGSYFGGKSIDLVVYEDDTLSVWFESDLPSFFNMLVNQPKHGWNLDVHPLFAVVAYPSIRLLHSITGIKLTTAIRVFAAMQAMLWVTMLYVTLRLIGCRRFDATLFSILGMTSAAAVFWLVVPESYILGSVSILLALMTVILAQHRQLAPLWYAGVNTLTLGFSVTNWMAGIIATLVNHRLKRMVQIMVNGFFAMVILWMVGAVFFPQAPFLFSLHPDRARYFFTPLSGGPLNILISFVFHSMIMPAFVLVDRFSAPPTDWPYNWPIMVTQYAWPGSGPQPWGMISVVLWGALLACGTWAIFQLKQQTKLRIALGLMILGQLLLHMIYGEETFLYSMHFAPLLVILVALGALTRRRLVVLTLAGALILTVGINNGLQFVEATSVVDCLRQNDTNITTESLLPQPSSDSEQGKKPLDKAKLIVICGGEAQSTLEIELERILGR